VNRNMFVLPLAGDILFDYLVSAFILFDPEDF